MGATRNHRRTLVLQGFANECNTVQHHGIQQECPRSAQSTSLPKHKTRLQARFGRIFANVGLYRAEVLRASNEAIEIVGLPEGLEGAEAGLVDQTARNAFPALQRVGQRFAIAEREEHVDVIGHDDVAPEVVTQAVEVMQAVGDDLSEA